MRLKRIKLFDGYIESPFGHHENATQDDKESEYYMQTVMPQKIERLMLRTAIGYRLTFGVAEDIWLNYLGVAIPDAPNLPEINLALKKYLDSREWFKEMEKLTGWASGYGESILMLYFDEDISDTRVLEKEVSENQEILRVEAFGYMNYKVIEWDKYGDPALYVINLPGMAMSAASPSTFGTRVHASRVLRFVNRNIDKRETGFGNINVVADDILILTNILKAAGEASYRWGTGHPVILTKDITTAEEVSKIKDIIGIPTRRSWHILPSEFVQDFKMVGQAGSMLNLQALANIVLDDIVAGTSFPKQILMGEHTGLVGSEIEDRGYFGYIDKRHKDLEPFVKLYFRRDINIRKLLYKYPYWEIDWGIREVLSKLDQITYRQKEISNALALTSICTVNECRAMIGIPPIPPEMGGDIILGIGIPSDESNNSEEETKGTDKSSTDHKDLEKDKTINKNKMRENKKMVKDAISSMRSKHSMDEISKSIGISANTLYKLENWANTDSDDLSEEEKNLFTEFTEKEMK